MDEGVVTLKWYEIYQAAMVGAWRHISALRQGSADAHGLSEVDGWGLHIEGACGEMAFAKFSGQYWPGGVDTYHGPDLGQRTQVRTRSRHDYDLIVRPGDQDDALFVLVTGACPTFRIRGFCYGWEAKDEAFLQQYGGRPAAYFVPPSRLHPWAMA